MYVTGVSALGWHQIGKFRADANLRYLYCGPKHPGQGRQKTYSGKVNWSNLSRFELLRWSRMWLTMGRYSASTGFGTNARFTSRRPESH